MEKIACAILTSSGRSDAPCGIGDYGAVNRREVHRLGLGLLNYEDAPRITRYPIADAPASVNTPGALQTARERVLIPDHTTNARWSRKGKPRRYLVRRGCGWQDSPHQPANQADK